MCNTSWLGCLWISPISFKMARWTFLIKRSSSWLRRSVCDISSLSLSSFHNRCRASHDFKRFEWFLDMALWTRIVVCMLLRRRAASTRDSCSMALRVDRSRSRCMSSLEPRLEWGIADDLGRTDGEWLFSGPSSRERSFEPNPVLDLRCAVFARMWYCSWRGDSSERLFLPSALSWKPSSPLRCVYASKSAGSFSS